jgi:myo-inositol-1(or 4)-monophosphatase
VIGDELLAVAEAAARAAASELLTHQDEAHSSVESKSTPTDPVSAADLAAESAIRAVLAEQRPDDAILGEEGDDSPGTSGLRWVVDPLDGTVNYLYAIPQWCVSVACEGQVGVIFDPLGDELFSVIVGQRPLLNGEPIAPSGCERVDRALVATGFGYDPGHSIVKARQAGVDLVLFKPFRVDQLLDTVEKSVLRRGAPAVGR